MFSDRLRILRQERSLKQSDIAKYLGVSAQSYSSYENGREPNYEMLKKLCSFFNVSSDWLLGLSEYRQPFNLDSLFPDALDFPDNIQSLIKNTAAELVSISLEFQNTAPKELHALLEQELTFLSRVTTLTQDFLQQIVQVRESGKKQQDSISSYQEKLSLEVISNSIKLTEKVARYQVQRALDHAEKLKAEYESLADPNSLEQAGPLKKINEEIQSLKMMLKAADGAFYYFFFDDDQEAGEPDGQHPKD